jgi:hypothetical protein
MRRRTPVAHPGAVRILVDLERDPDGRVSGRIAGDDQQPVTFSGWLELLRLLEDRADASPQNRQETPWDG